MSTGTGRIKLYARNNILLKKLQIWDMGSFIFWSKFRFCGAAWGVFFLIFRRRSNMVADIFTQPPPRHHKTYLSYYLLIYMLHNQSRLTKFSNYIFFYIRSCHPMEFQTLDPLLKWFYFQPVYKNIFNILYR